MTTNTDFMPDLERSEMRQRRRGNRGTDYTLPQGVLIGSLPKVQAPAYKFSSQRIGINPDYSQKKPDLMHLGMKINPGDFADEAMLAEAYRETHPHREADTAGGSTTLGLPSGDTGGTRSIGRGPGTGGALPSGRTPLGLPSGRSSTPLPGRPGELPRGRFPDAIEAASREPTAIDRRMERQGVGRTNFAAPLGVGKGSTPSGDFVFSTGTPGGRSADYERMGGPMGASSTVAKFAKRNPGTKAAKMLRMGKL